MTFRSGWHQVAPRQKGKSPARVVSLGKNQEVCHLHRSAGMITDATQGLADGRRSTWELRCSGVRVVAAVAADLDLKRRQVVQAALLHLVAQALLLLLDHGAPHLLQRGVVLLLRHLPSFLSLASSPLGGGRRRRRRRVSAWRAVVGLALLTRAALVVAGAQAAPQVTCSERSTGWQVEPRTRC